MESLLPVLVTSGCISAFLLWLSWRLRDRGGTTGERRALASFLFALSCILVPLLGGLLLLRLSDHPYWGGFRFVLGGFMFSGFALGVTLVALHSTLVGLRNAVPGLFSSRHPFALGGIGLGLVGLIACAAAVLFWSLTLALCGMSLCGTAI